MSDPVVDAKALREEARRENLMTWEPLPEPWPALSRLITEVERLRVERDRLVRGVVDLWERFGTGEKRTGWNGCACPEPDHIGGSCAEVLGLDYFADITDGRALLGTSDDREGES